MGRVILAFIVGMLTPCAVGMAGALMMGLLLGDEVDPFGAITLSILSLFISLPLSVGAAVVYWLPIALFFHWRKWTKPLHFTIAGGVFSLGATFIFVIGMSDGEVTPYNASDFWAMTIYSVSIFAAGPLAGLVYGLLLRKPLPAP